MEEDIKLLEKLVECDIETFGKSKKHVPLNGVCVIAIKNLINKNKELEEEVKQRKKYWEKRFVEYHKVIELMADSLSDVAFYMDEASEYCEVKKKECDCYQNKAGCKKCLLDYFRKKVRVI